MSTHVMLNHERSSAARWRTRTRQAIAAAALIEAAAFATAAAQTPERPFDIGERLRYRVSVAKFGNIGEGDVDVISVGVIWKF